MHKETKMTAISAETKRAVFARDKGRCVVCRRPGFPNSHVIRRSRGGMGVIENIVTHCLDCHRRYDAGEPAYITATMNYIYRLYPEWEREKVIYKKWNR